MQDSAVAAENDMGGPKSTWFHKKKIYFIRNQIVGNGYYLSNVILATVSKANYYGNYIKIFKKTLNFPLILISKYSVNSLI